MLMKVPRNYVHLSELLLTLITDENFRCSCGDLHVSSYNFHFLRALIVRNQHIFESVRRVSVLKKKEEKCRTTLKSTRKQTERPASRAEFDWQLSHRPRRTASRKQTHQIQTRQVGCESNCQTTGSPPYQTTQSISSSLLLNITSNE